MRVSLLCSASLLALLSGCDLRPPHVVLTVEDPDGVASAATALAVGFSADSLTVAERRDKPFPLTVAVVAPGPGTRSLQVEARDASGAPLARGQVQVEFPKEGTGSATVALGRACSDSAACDDEVFCNGAETCSAFGACVRGQTPCASPPYPCVDLTCVEAAKACSTRVDHSRCTPATLPDGTLQARYCDPSSGCVPGKACATAEECQDGSVCNGEERCTYFHCVAGEPVLLDDLDPCTLDYCLDPEGPRHLANPELEGAACTLADDSRLHLCRRGVCVASRCGDRVVDPRSEACDDSNDDPNDGCDKCQHTRWTSVVVTGLGRNQGLPRQLSLMSPDRMAAARTGTLYLADYLGERVWRIESDRVSVAAGEGITGFSGDRGPAASARLDSPTSVAVDGEENLYIADRYNRRIRRVDGRTGQITTIAGGGEFADEEIPATAIALERPVDVAVDGTGNVYLLLADDANRGFVRRIDAETGLIVTVAGTEDPTPGDGPALSSRIENPTSMVLASASSLYVGEATRVRLLSFARPGDPTSGKLTQVAGNGDSSSGSGVPALEAGVCAPTAMALDEEGRLYLADRNMNAIRRITWSPRLSGGSVIETVVGNGAAGRPVDGPALDSPVGSPKGLAFAPDGALFYSDDTTLSVRRVERPSESPATWTTRLYAGGVSDLATLEEVPPTTTRIWSHSMAAFGDQLLFADRDRNVVWSIEQVDPADPMTWKLARVAGGGASRADGVPARDAALSFDLLGGLATGPDGALYLSCSGEGRLRRVMLDPAHPRHGLIDTVAGDGSATTHGDDGLAVQAGLPAPFQVALDPAQRLFVTSSNRVRYVMTDPAKPVGEWTIHAAAGTGAVGHGGDGGPAAEATFEELYGIAASSQHVFVTSKTSPDLRAFSTSGAPWTLFRAGGTGLPGYTPSGPVAGASFRAPYGLAMDQTRQVLYLADRLNYVVQRLAVDGADPLPWTLDTLNQQGSTTDNFHGEGQPVGQAMLYAPRGVAVGARGDLYVNLFDAIRRVTFHDRNDPATWTITTLMGGIDPEGDGPLALGGVGAAQALALFDPLHVAVTDGPNGHVRWVDLERQQVRTVAGTQGGTASGPAARSSRLLRGASGIAFDSSTQSFLVAEATGHLLRRLRVTDLAKPWTWSIEDLAGQLDLRGHVDGPLSDARFDGPAGLALDASRRVLYVADSRNHVLRAIRLDAPEAADCVTTLAGVPGHLGYLEGPADRALFHSPSALALDGSGGLYVADTGNHRVRRLDLATRTVTTVLGTGVGGSSGTGAPARLYPVDAPRGVAVDAQGNLFVTSRDSVRLVTRGADGPVADGSGTVFTILDAATSRSKCLTGLQLLPGEQDLLVLDECQGLLLRLERSAE